MHHCTYLNFLKFEFPSLKQDEVKTEILTYTFPKVHDSVECSNLPKVGDKEVMEKLNHFSSFFT
jgi:hypothetical protein